MPGKPNQAALQAADQPQRANTELRDAEDVREIPRVDSLKSSRDDDVADCNDCARTRHHRHARLLSSLLPSTKNAPEYQVVESLWNPANAVTLIRVFLCIGLLSYGALKHSHTVIYVALGTQWVLDFVDGMLARLFSCETRFGACFDAQSDRLVLSLFLITVWQMWPYSRPAIVVYLVYIILIDGAMFTQAMQSGVLSTNYYYVIDRTAWRLCWSPFAKFTTAVLAPALILLGNHLELGTAVAVVAGALRFPVLKRVLLQNDREPVA